MASRASDPIVFLVPGEAQPLEAASRGGGLSSREGGGRLKHSVRVAAQRAGASPVRVEAVPGEDVVLLHLAGGPTLTLHPEHARALMLAQSGGHSGAQASRSRGAPDEAPLPGEVEVAARLSWAGAPQAAATRGLVGDVVLAAVEVLTGVARQQAAGMLADEGVARLDAQVEPGVYRLQPERLERLKGNSKPLPEVPAPKDGAPLLVLVHGTFSDTSGSFGKLWRHHPQRVRQLFRRHADQVYALDHPTLGASPIANALTLAQALPDGARLHLLTHSRGGLVAEVLARLCARPQLTPLDRQHFAGDDQREELRQLEALAELVRRKRLRVERMVRVACPARGTLLASKRLDAYLSVFKWALEVAQVPLLPGLVEFLGEVAQCRTDPTCIPGLAAMMPGSPLLQWLQAVDEPLPGELYVVAGDLEGDSLASWLKTLLSDGFYWTDNDLVVQTRSMYGGAPRAGGARFLLDQGGQVSHFSYFTNESSAEAIVQALLQEHRPPQDFLPIGPLSWAGADSFGMRGASEAGPAAGGRLHEKPALILLPGLFASHLKVDGRRIWLGWRLGGELERLRWQADGADGVQPDGLVGGVHDELQRFLAPTHEVIGFAWDWRRPLEEEARRLGGVVEAALAARAASGQPVRLLAHSSGGLLARTLQLECPQLWERLMAHAGARLLLLGVPNGGCWTPMQLLSGDDPHAALLAAFGAPFREHEARQLLAGFPGLLQLQAGLQEPGQGLARQRRWEELAEADLARLGSGSWHDAAPQREAGRWGVPTQAVLDRAVALRRRLDAQLSQDLPRFSDKLVMVVGRAPATPDGCELTEDGLVYLDAPDGAGDGRVALASALLPGVRTWVLDQEHGRLPAHADAFEAYLQLLERGATALDVLQPLDAVRARGDIERPHVRGRPARGRFGARPPVAGRELLASPEPKTPPAAAGAPALQVTVVNGDLVFLDHPLLIGHYHSLKLTGTEKAVDELLGGALGHSLKAGLYPGRPGTHQVFVNSRSRPDQPWQMPRPEAVIVAGLGDEGKLRAAELVHTVRQAVIAWAQRMGERRDAPPQFELAATLIGSGGVGISAGQSAQLVAQGVREANQRLAESGWPSVGRLHLVDLYLDRASEAWRALQVQAAALPERFALGPTVHCGTGALQRPLDFGYRGTDYDLISATSQQDERGDAVVAYTIDTKRARSEVRAQATQGRLLRQLVKEASNDREGDGQIGRTLFRLLVPVEMEPFLGGTSDLLLELDGGTAAIPWELLDTPSDGGDRRPWAIRTKLLRKLRTASFRAQVLDAGTDASVLVIGEPQCDAQIYPRLPGARKEARQVVRSLTAGGALAAQQVTLFAAPEDDPARPGADARTIINALLARDWRIVHIAGHGEPPELDAPRFPGDDAPPRVRDPRGVVLSDGTFLGPREIQSMRTVPELVFINCCHSGARDASQALRGEAGAFGRPYDRVQFAAGVAEELIRIGVRCVVATGWAVDDAAAEAFAQGFYAALLRGARFIDAVAEARAAAHRCGGLTWAAYQCYGDPDWFFRREGADAQRPRRSPAEEFASVASSQALRLALETLAVEGGIRHGREEPQRLEQLRARIRYLEARFAPEWGDMGAVAEAFGAAWAAADELGPAIDWYRRAREAADGGATLKALEQLCRLRVRQAWETVDAKQREWLRLEHELAALHRRGTPRQGLKPLESALKEKQAERRAAARTARETLREVLDPQGPLAALQSTLEREQLAGSACQRLAMLHRLLGEEREARAAVERMRAHYARACAQGPQAEAFHPALRLLAADVVLDTPDPDAARVAGLHALLQERIRREPDFGSIAGEAEFRVLQAVQQGALRRLLPELQAGFAELHLRLQASSSWASVHEQIRFVTDAYLQRLQVAQEGEGADAAVAREEAAAVHELQALLAGYAHQLPA